nr:reverse transcriptase domain-containing protein [Tanacetum cinerariifolium]
MSRLPCSSPRTKKLATKTDSLVSSWLFYKRGIDIAGPFPEGPGKVKFLIVAINYFTKWIEEKPVITIMGNQIKKFIRDNIVCKFSLPGEIISDNEKQFKDNPFKDWCEKLCICQRFTSIKRPQSNGLVERANKSLGEGIKARLDERRKDWIEEIPHILWAHRTMIKSSNRDTPFSLTCGIEAVILTKIGMPTLRTAEIDMNLVIPMKPLQKVSDTGSASEGSAKKKGITVAVTTEDMQKRRNDVKARTTLLLALPDEHQLRFSKYKTAQELWAAILKTFGGNEATKKTKKNQLK